MSRFTIFIFIFSLYKLWAQQDYTDSVQQLRVAKTAELIDPTSKLLTDEEIDHFQGLDFFPIDQAFMVEARFEKSIGRKFRMATTTDRLPIYRRYGYVYFIIGSDSCRLTVYQNMELRKKEGYKDYLFIPFKDATAPELSYGGGRYLDARIPKGTTMLLDFNLTYNPYCAYSYRYSCPIPPEENVLDVRIEAGEKNPLGHSSTH